MDQPQRGKRPNRRRRAYKPRRQQQHREAGAQRSWNALIDEPERTRLAKLGYSSPRACALTISTRGIGLMVSLVTTMLRQKFHLNSEDIPVAAIYRASLAQLQTKMRFVKPISVVNDFPPFEYAEKSEIDWNTAETIRHGNYYNLSQVALIIDSVGNVEINNKSFTPVFSSASNALNIRLDNLREYCRKMSELETDSSERLEGYKLNSIPNAKWERYHRDDENSIRLTNPDEIISPDYDCNDSQTVVNDLLVTHRFCHGKYRFGEFRAMVNYDNNGDPAILVSTHVIPGQSLKVDNEVITGTQKEFWSSELIPEESWCLGVLGLVGETLNPMDGSSRSNVVAMRSVVDWRQISGMLL